MNSIQIPTIIAHYWDYYCWPYQRSQGVVPFQYPFVIKMSTSHSNTYTFSRGDFLNLLFFLFHIIIIASSTWKSAVARCSQSIMAETYISFGQHAARVSIEEKEIPHYAMSIDRAKKEVSCWIPSEEGKVRESFRCWHLAHSNTSRRFLQIG